MDFWLSTEVQTALAMKLVDSPANKDVKLPDDIAKNLTYGEETARNLKLVPSAVAIDQRNTWVKEWNDKIGQ
jgi:putative spermidine/putrescine transport system substrate-binding protein